MQHRHKRNCANLTTRIYGHKIHKKIKTTYRIALCVRDFIKYLPLIIYVMVDVYNFTQNQVVSIFFRKRQNLHNTYRYMTKIAKYYAKTFVNLQTSTFYTNHPHSI